MSRQHSLCRRECDRSVVSEVPERTGEVESSRHPTNKRSAESAIEKQEVDPHHLLRKLDAEMEELRKRQLLLYIRAVTNFLNPSSKDVCHAL